MIFATLELERIKRGEMRRFVDFMKCNKQLIEQTYQAYCKEDEEISEDKRVCIAHNLLFLQMKKICFRNRNESHT